MNTRLFLILLIGLCLGVGIPMLGLPDETTSPPQNTPSPPDPIRAGLSIQTGIWVKYQIKRSQKKDAGFKVIWVSDLKISIVGQEPKTGRYWIELVANPVRSNPESTRGAPPTAEGESRPRGRKADWTSNGANENTENARVIKFLITPKGEPVQEKLIVQNSGLKSVEIDLNLWASKLNLTPQELFHEMTYHFMIVPLEPFASKGELDELKLALSSESKSGKTSNQTIACLRYLAEDPARKVITKLWQSEQIPFPGVVKMLLFEKTYQTKIILIGYGTKGGVSLIKERPLPLKFRERK